MLDIFYKPSFIKQYDKLEKSLKEEVKEKIVLFRNTRNHKLLKVHKLHGRLKNFWSFSVNYKYRIVFEYGRSKKVYLVDIGDHDIYK